jgi:LytS/YehU family sensor histidine kinase
MYVLNRLDGKLLNLYFSLNLLTTFTLGIVISHSYRYLILKRNWLGLKIVQLIPRVLGASLLCGLVYFFLHSLISELINGTYEFSFDSLEILQTTLNLAVIFMVWSLLYFLFHFIQNYRKEEIKNLRWEAAKNEMELNKLKSQLNPHFIFNSMNSIRALIDEDPAKSKQSVTRLANILRSSLLMGRKKVIPFEEELQLVNDYLNLEKTRFEERLSCEFSIEDNTKSHMIPPMLLQTLVENGIKHGVSKLQDGGLISVKAWKENGSLNLTIFNSGVLKVDSHSDTGFGLVNTKQRLQLLYGNRALFAIQNVVDGVLAELLIPEDIHEFNLETDESTDH